MTDPATTRDNTFRVLAEILRCGPVEGRVRLQKLMFLMRERGLTELDGVEFTYHHYGPYSALAMDIVQDAVAADLVEEKRETFDDEWQRFQYSLTEAADRLSRLPAPSRDLVRRVVEASRDVHWRSLELAATAEFLEDEGLSPTEAWTRALKLKPACEPHADEARSLVDALPARRVQG